MRNVGAGIRVWSYPQLPTVDASLGEPWVKRAWEPVDMNLVHWGPAGERGSNAAQRIRALQLFTVNRWLHLWEARNMADSWRGISFDAGAGS